MPDAPATAASTAPKTEAAQVDALFQPFNRSDAPGLVVGIARRGRVIYRKAFGLASVQHGVANTPGTRMRIGSTSKHFTCLSALLLAEDGKLDIDAPVTRYLEELRFTGAVPTLRQFMNHTSGMHDSLDLAVMANGPLQQPKGWQLKRLAQQRDVNFEPGNGQTYNNGGYHLLSIAIDRSAGMSYEQFLKQRVLEPLGMNATEPAPGDFRMLPGVASNHLPDPAGGWRIGQFPNEEIRGEGSLVSSVDDMLRWIAHLNGPKVVGSADSWREMLTPPVLKSGLRSIYGLGLYRHDYRGVEVIHHAGGVIGGNSQMLTVPAHGLDIALMVNGALLNASAMGWKLVDLLLAEVLQPETRKRPQWADYARMDGTRYHGASGTMIGFGKAAESELGLSFNTSPPLSMMWEQDDTLRVGWEDAALGPVEFSRDEMSGTGEPPRTLTYREAGRVETLLRVDDTRPALAEAGRPMPGRYRSHDLDADAEIAFEGDELVIRIRGDYSAARRYALKAWSATAFEMVDPEQPVGGMFAVTAEHHDGVTQRFWLDGVRARHVAFDRVG
jgi:CubicO group peptidase (beta-lactamase class C family)